MLRFGLSTLAGHEILNATTFYKGTPMPLRKLSIVAVGAAISLALTSCSVGSNAAPTPTQSSAAITVDSAAAALLPSDVATSGELVIGAGTDYPPNESVDQNGNPSGWGIELAQAIAAKLGLKAKLEVADFDKIIPSILAGSYAFGEYSFTDNAEREKQVDFVNYYNAGIQWVSGADKTVDPNNACGLKIAVYATSYEDTDELPAKSAACVAAGKPALDILKFDGQEGATNAVALGQADATSTDSPIAFAAIAASKGKLKAAGASFEVAPYGLPVAKDTTLGQAIQKALQSLIDDGTYLNILKKYGVESGAVSSATINAGAK
jgi:polar amino acid transport system substrate-binding protein